MLYTRTNTRRVVEHSEKYVPTRGFLHFLNPLFLLPCQAYWSYQAYKSYKIDKPNKINKKMIYHHSPHILFSTTSQFIIFQMFSRCSARRLR